jgi:hypothetical protein
MHSSSSDPDHHARRGQISAAIHADAQHSQMRCVSAPLLDAAAATALLPRRLLVKEARTSLPCTFHAHSTRPCRLQRQSARRCHRDRLGHPDLHGNPRIAHVRSRGPQLQQPTHGGGGPRSLPGRVDAGSPRSKHRSGLCVHLGDLQSAHLEAPTRWSLNQLAGAIKLVREREREKERAKGRETERVSSVRRADRRSIEATAQTSSATMHSDHSVCATSSLLNRHRSADDSSSVVDDVCDRSCNTDDDDDIDV